jgi:putative SOS response-associated peptidase YedK
MLRSGLIPAWTEDIKKAPLLINAKSETAATKPSFRSAFKRRRCLVVANGYYEWRAIANGRCDPTRAMKWLKSWTGG